MTPGWHLGQLGPSLVLPQCPREALSGPQYSSGKIRGGGLDQRSGPFWLRVQMNLVLWLQLTYYCHERLGSLREYKGWHS